MKYTIGIDLGVSSVGWSIIDNEKGKLEKCGVRSFSQSNSAADRRIARSSRRRLKRKKRRVEATLIELEKIHFPFNVTIDPNLLEKRFLGIKEKLEKQDITNILCYMMSYRGYIPYEDEIKSINLDGKLPCEYLKEKYKEVGKYRALNIGLNQEINYADNLREIKELLKIQSKFYAEISKEFMEIIEKTFLRKRKFWEGPGNLKTISSYGRFKNKKEIEDYLNFKKINKNYEKYLFEDLIGNCELLQNEKKATTTNFYAEYFNFLNDVININFKDIDQLKNKNYFIEAKNSYKLNKEGITAIKEYIFKNPERIGIKTILKNIFETDINNIEGYRISKSGEIEFSLFETYREFLKLVRNGSIKNILIENIDNYNQMLKILTIAPSFIEAKKLLEGNNFKYSEEEYNVLYKIYLSLNKRYHALSEKILKRAIQDMENNMLNFMQVRKKFNYDKERIEKIQQEYKITNNFLNLSYIDDIIASPQVKKSLRQAIKVINAIIKEKKGLPENIVVESTKEMNGQDKIYEINKEQRLQEKLRNEASEFIKNNFGKEYLSEKNIEKFMVYNETNGHCIYCNNPIDINEIINPKYEVEHILPYSNSFDDSFNNKTIACTNCNKNKNNRTPYQFLGSAFEEFEKRVKQLNISERKLKNLLDISNVSKYEKKFFNRNLRDTAYGTTELINQINMYNYYLQLDNNKKIKVLSIPGILTHNIRDKYSLSKDRSDGLFHHAVDATIVASISNSEYGKLLIEAQNETKFWKNQQKVAELKNLESKYISIKNNLEDIENINNDNVYISSEIIKNSQRKLANTNIYKIIEKENEYYKIEQIDNIYEENFSDKKVKEKFDKLFLESDKTFTLLCYDNNKNQFNFLKNIYLKFKNDKGNPFVNYCKELYGIDKNIKFDYQKYGIKYPENKINAPIIKKLRYYSSINDPYLLEKNNINKKANTKIALESLSQLCTQVFVDLENKKFIFLPVYIISINSKTKKIDKNHMLYKKLYSKYIGNKKVKYVIDLYNGDFIEIVKNNNEIISNYFSTFNKTINSIVLKNKKYFTRSDKKITVYTFDILGNKYCRLTEEI